MSNFVTIFAGVLITLALIFFAWWMIVGAEGVYLGRRTVIFLYDLYANRYDNVKNYLPEFEHALIAYPLMEAIAPYKAPLVLDVATGTGRIPIALLNHKDFQGRVIGVDLSRRMLHQAALKLDGYLDRAPLIWWSAEDLPFADNTFDVVTCLESLEFMTNPKAVLEEMARVLRPGGIVLTTRRINTRFMPGKVWTEDEMRKLLDSFDIDPLADEVWQHDYNKVWGRKRGESSYTGTRPLGEVLRCPACPQSLMVEDEDGYWYCEDCRARARIGDDGVLELYKLET